MKYGDLIKFLAEILKDVAFIRRKSEEMIHDGDLHYNPNLVIPCNQIFSIFQILPIRYKISKI